ncbi:MAG: hypothetical protein R3B06_24985 [Kofleriaceae bacterium]
MRLQARYPTAAALGADVAEQLGRGGLLVRGPVPDGLELFAPVELEVVCGGAAVVVTAQVLQLFPGIGVAVGVDAAARDAIAALARGDEAEADPAPPPDGGTATRARAHAADMLAKIQRALTGDRDARLAVLRDPNRTVHVHILRNPGLRADEVAAIARMTTVSIELLTQIASRREYGQRPEIAIALVRNPTMPIPAAIELLRYVSEGDLKQLAKDNRTRDPIQRAARKRLVR